MCFPQKCLFPASSHKNVFSPKMLEYGITQIQTCNGNKYQLMSNFYHKNVFHQLSGFPSPPHLQASEEGNLSTYCLALTLLYFYMYRVQISLSYNLHASNGSASASTFNESMSKMLRTTWPGLQLMLDKRVIFLFFTFICICICVCICICFCICQLQHLAPAVPGRALTDAR